MESGSKAKTERRVHLFLITSVILLLTSCGDLYTETGRITGEVERILVSGQGGTGPFLRVLNRDGTVDAGFSATIDGVIFDVALLDRETLLIGGQFSTVNGVPVTGLAAVDAKSGAYVPGYAPLLSDPGLPEVREIEVTPEGEIYIGGTWTEIAGSTEHPNLARLSEDGSLDTGFPIGADGAVGALLSANGWVYVGGAFTKLGPTSGSQPAAPGFGVFRPESGVQSLQTPISVSAGPITDFAIRRDRLVAAVGDFDAGFMVDGANVVRSFLLLFDGPSPVDLVSANLPTAGGDWFVTESPGGGLLVALPAGTPSGDQVGAYLAWYDASLTPTLQMPVNLNNGVSVQAAGSGELYIAGGFTGATDPAGNSGDYMIRVRGDLYIDPGFAPIFDGPVFTVYPLPF